MLQIFLDIVLFIVEFETGTNQSYEFW